MRMMGYGYGPWYGWGFLFVLVYIGAIVYGFYLLANIAAATKRSATAIERIALRWEQGGPGTGAGMGTYRNPPPPPPTSEQQ